MDHASQPDIPLADPSFEPDPLGYDLMRRHPWLLGVRNGLLGVAILGGLAYLIATSTARSRAQFEEITASDRVELDEVSDLRAVGFDEKGKTWEVYSAGAVEDEKTNRSEIRQISVLNIFKEGEVNITGRGDLGFWNKGTKTLELRDNVTLTDREGTTTLYTSLLTWRESTEELVCPGPVDVIIENNHIVADALLADRDLENMHFLGNVRMYATGLSKPGVLTREGIVDPEDAEPAGDEESGAGDGLWIAGEYLLYAKENKTATCYPFIPQKIQNQLENKLKERERTLQAAEMGRALPPLGTTPEEYLASTRTHSAHEIDYLFGPAIPEPLKERRGRQVFAWRTNKRLFCNRMDIDLTGKRVDPEEDVFFYAASLQDRLKPDATKTAKALAKEPTSISSSYMRYYWKTGFLEAWGGVEAYQREKRLTADHMVHHEAIAITACDGNVAVHQSSGHWLEREGLLEDVTEEKAREDALKPTTIYADALLAYEEPSYLYFAGHVKVIQPDQRAYGDIGEYHDEKEWIHLTGNVDYSNTKGEVLIADDLVLWLDKNTYEATNVTQTKVLMPEKYARQIDEAKEENE